MKSFVLLFLTIFTFCGCKKSNTEITSDILYSEISPNIILGYDSVNHKVPWYLDIDNDSITDFSMEPGYLYIWPDTINPIGNYFSLWALDSNLVYGHYFQLLEEGDTISKDCSPWQIEFMFHVYTTYCVDDTCKFIGLALSKNNNKYYGWLKVDWNSETKCVRLRSYAIRKSPNIPILTGQNH